MRGNDEKENVLVFFDGLIKERYSFKITFPIHLKFIA
jgi:hypothetical protein